MTEIPEIVLVEDNLNDAELGIRALRKNNILNNIIHLQNGEEVLEYIFATGKYTGRNVNDIPKLILLDLKMPKMNGLDVLKRLKSDENTKVIPIVLLTSSSEERDIAEAYKLGVNSYIVKPVEFENFTQSVAQIGSYWLLLNKYLK